MKTGDTIALLIDADNVSAKYVKLIFEELNKLGTVSIRRIYGNWSKGTDWTSEIMLEYSIQPIQQFDYTRDKNATDISMVIDAMDLLYTKEVDIFCIVTSDSDFTRLAMRLRESQRYVIGMGESKTPSAMTKSCDKFLHLDLIYSEEAKTDDSGENTITPLSEIQDAILHLISEKDTEPLTLGEAGNYISKQFTDFDVRNYGYTKLNVLVKEEFDKIKMTQKGNNYYLNHAEINEFDEIKKEIIHYITVSGGTVKNISLVHDHIRSIYSSFKPQNYGYSKISSLLKSIDGIVINSNKVKLVPSHSDKK